MPGRFKTLILHPALLATALLAVLAATGCTRARVGTVVTAPEARAALRGQELGQEPFDRVRAPEGRLSDFVSSTYWLLPVNVTARAVSVQDPFTPEAKIEATKFIWNDLGPLFILLLPVRAVQHQYLYDNPGLPSGEQHLTWTPFWTWVSRENWPQDQLQLEAKGVPLLAAWGKASQEGETKATLFHSLWSLGPMVLRFPDGLQMGDDPENDPVTKGFIVTPLLLGGLPGLAVWTSADVTTTSPADAEMRHRVQHGPLFGLLGYFENSEVEGVEADDQQAEAEEIEESVLRTVLGGILWMDWSEQDRNQPWTRDAGHGPLWTAFGWGRSEGRPTLRLLWIPIPVGSGPAGADAGVEDDD